MCFIFVTFSYAADVDLTVTYTNFDDLCRSRQVVCPGTPITYQRPVEITNLFAVELLSRVTSFPPRSKGYYLKIDVAGKQSLCTEGDNNDKCNERLVGELYRFPTTATTKFNVFKKVQLYGEIDYVNKAVFYEIFPELTIVTFTRSEFKDVTIPITKRSLKVFTLHETNRLENVKVDPNMLPITETFILKTGAIASRRLQVQQISGGLSLKLFKIIANADTLFIALPKVDVAATIASIIIGYYGNNPDNVKVSYERTMGKITSMDFLFSKRPSQVKHFWPEGHIYVTPTDIFIRIMNREELSKPFLDMEEFTEKYKVEEWVFHKHITEDKQTAVSPEDRTSLKKVCHSSPLKVTQGRQPGDPIVLDFLITDIAAIMLSTSDKTKTYTVNTYFLVLDEKYSGSTLHLITDVTINYQLLIYIDYPQLFGFKMKRKDAEWKSIQFNNIDNIIDIWKPYTIESIYAIITGIVNAMKPNYFPESMAFKKLRSKIANTLLDQIDIEKMFTREQQEDNSYHYIHNAIKKINDLKLFFNTYGENARRLPRLSENLYKEKTLIYHEIAKTLISTEKVSDLRDGQKILLSISEKKSETEVAVAGEQQKILDTRAEDARKTLDKLRGKRMLYEREYKQNAVAFNAAVKRREAQAYLDAALSIFSAITSIFSGGIGAISQIGDLSNAITKLVKTIKKIQKLIGRITIIIETIANLATAVRDTYNNINVVQEGFNPKFDISQVEDVVNKVSNLDAADILEWDLAAGHVDGMMDASLSAEIPETLSYKTSILKMIAAGKAETEASIDYAMLQSDIYMNQFKLDGYIQEIKFINDAKNKMNAGQYNNEFLRNIKLSGMQLKLDLFLHMTDYCDSSFYYNLQPCYAYTEFSFGSRLDQILFISNKILTESFANMNDLFPPPQTFIDKSIVVELDATCEDIIEEYNGILDSDKCKNTFTSADCRVKASTVCRNALAASGCTSDLQVKMNEVVDADNNDDDETRRFNAKVDVIAGINSDAKKEIKFERIYLNCLSSPVRELKTKKETLISISLENEEFKTFDRVRVDEVKVILHGAESNSQFMEVAIENQGVVADRLNGKTFVFTGDKWKRITRYKPAENIYDIKFQIKGDVHKDFRTNFNNPTPFSTWRIFVSDTRNPGLDLSGVTSIEIMFSGSLMVTNEHNIIESEVPNDVPDE